MKEQYQKIPEKIRGSIEFALFLATLGLMFYGLDAVYDSQNLLTDAKTNKQSPPGEICIDSQGIYGSDMGCWSQKVDELCDGQNTILNRSDDVCETIEYWSYRPVVAR